MESPSEALENNIKVVARLRPLLPREIGSSSLIEMPSNGKVILHSQQDTKGIKQFQFDDTIWSFNRGDSRYIDNKGVYDKLGRGLLDHYCQGYNVCLLAYGQTGSGKTFTMMGQQSELGIIPLLINDILQFKARVVDEKLNCELSFSYMEIYNETVKDLLDPSTGKLKVREHSETGTYVEGLKSIRIETFDEFLEHLNTGNANRSTASTLMNDNSSRSHAIINLNLKQTKFESGDIDLVGNATTEVVSNIKLVDLAGSERLNKTRIIGNHERMKEGGLINKSLTVLGRCINILAKNNPQQLAPYRDSILTYILKENLGGNSKTMMMFCVSPIDYDESLQTLNYALRVKQIKTKATANSAKLIDTSWNQLDQNDVIEKLKVEIQQLTDKLKNLDDGVSISKLVPYLERQLTDIKFENKYLSSRLKHVELEKDELHKHNQYLMKLLIDNQTKSHEMRNEVIQDNLKHIQDQLVKNKKEIDEVLDEFKPFFDPVEIV